MSESLDQSYRLCHDIARNTGKNFYYSFLVMPRAKREETSRVSPEGDGAEAAGG